MLVFPRGDAVPKAVDPKAGCPNAGLVVAPKEGVPKEVEPKDEVVLVVLGAENGELGGLVCPKAVVGAVNGEAGAVVLTGVELPNALWPNAGVLVLPKPVGVVVDPKDEVVEGWEVVVPNAEVVGG